MFSWNETEFIEFLGVIPEITDEFGICHTFKLVDGHITLTFSINPDVGDCSLQVHHASQSEPIFQSVYLGSPGARIVNDKRGHYIELGQPGAFTGTYDLEQPLFAGLRIRVDPHISIETFGRA